MKALSTRRSLTAAAVLGITAALTLSACSSSSSGKSGSSAGGPVTLHFFGADYGTAGTSNSTQAYWQTIADAFHKANPNITVDVQTIDRINILQASRLAMKIAVEGLRQRGCDPDHLLIDGNQKIDAVCRQTTIVQGDARSLSIAAASVIAKVHRDRLLCELDARFPGYGLAHNKGYSTPEHKAALLRLGITEMHRRSFQPVAELFEVEVESIDLEFEFMEE